MSTSDLATHPIPKSPSRQRRGPTLELVRQTAAPVQTPESREDVRADVREVVAEAITLFRQPAGLRIGSCVPDRFPLLSVNPQRLRKVLRILLGLAAAAIPSGTARGAAGAEDELEVVVDSALPDETGPWIQILIRHTGRGAAIAVDHPRSGLTAARSFAASFGGRIHCRAQQPGVSDFVVMIPRK